MSAVAPALPARRFRTRRLALVVLAAAGLLVLAHFGWDWWTAGRFLESTDDAYVGGDITVIAPKVAGIVAEIAVTDNQAVKAGDLLARLDDRDVRAALAKAEAAVARQQAALANLDAQRRLQESLVDQAKAGIAATEAVIGRTRDDRARYQQLSARAFASVQAFQKADADYKQAMADGARAEAALAAATRQLAVLDTGRTELEAALAAAVADRDAAALTLSYAEIRAPVDGVVGNRAVQRGAYAAAGTPLLSLVPSRGLWVDANFKESQLADMRPGMAVTVVADVLPGRVFQGHVDSLAPATGAQFSILPPENATGNFTKIVQRVPVRILLDGEGGVLGALRPGLSVTVSVDHRGEGEHREASLP